MNFKQIFMYCVSYCKSFIKGEFKFLSYWKYIGFGIVCLYTFFLHLQTNNLKATTELAEQRAQTSEHALSVVMKNQEIVSRETVKLEKKREVSRDEAKSVKSAISTVVQPSNADAMQLQKYARTINSKYSSNSK